MSQHRAKRRRTSTNPFLDLEAAVDRDDEPEEREDNEDRAFIDDSLEGAGEGNDASSRQRLLDFLREDGQLGGGSALGEQDDGILREILALNQDGGCGSGENPLVGDDESDDNDEEEASVPRPLWAELGHVNAAVSGALDTWQDDDDERRVSSEDTLYEVSCQVSTDCSFKFGSI